MPNKKTNPNDPGAHHNSSGALIRRFLPYLAKHKAVLFLDLFCAALTTLCDIFLPKIMSTITNSAMGVGITLTIAHRLTTIKNYDRILVLGSEGIVESGTHEELLAKQGVYYRLWNQLPGEDTL